MAKIKGICKNIDDCNKAEGKEIQEIERSSKFECEECGKPLIEVKNGGGGKGNGKLPAIIAVVVVLLGGIAFGVWYFFFKPPSSITVSISPETPTVQVGETVRLTAKAEPENKKIKWVWASGDESIATVNERGVVTGVTEGSATITVTDEKSRASASVSVAVQSNDPKQEPEQQTQPEEPVQPVEEKKDTPKPVDKKPAGDGTKTYSFGRYEGKLLNGIPEGQGTMYYTRRVQIAKHGRNEYFAEEGDIFVGTWGNGDIINGNLFDRNNNQKAAILAGKRPNPYDLTRE